MSAARVAALRARAVAVDGQRLQRASAALAGLALAVYLTVSPALLTVLGIPYDAPYGSFVFKLHPGDYLLAAALMCSLAGQGNPLSELLRRLRMQPLLSAYWIAMSLAFGYSLLRHGPSGSAFFIDTLMMPVALALVMIRLDAAQCRGLLRLMLALLIANAVLGLLEAASARHLIPYTVAGGVPVIEDKFRATALLGHPLENALLTSMLLLATLDLPMSLLRRAALCGLSILALLAFGGRTSFLLTVLALLAYAAPVLWRGLLAGRYGYLHIVGALLAAMIAAPVAIAGVWSSGLGARIFQGLYFDGSAAVRLRIFSVFDYLDGYDIAFGISPQQIQDLSARIGLSQNLEAIENFWLFMLLQLGAPVFLAFAIGLACGLGWLWRRTGVGGRWALAVFVITASTTNSLASKTSALTLLFALLCAVAGARRGDARPRASLLPRHGVNA
ncbi:VpsF family polysaccharide biosynthesis protein [Pseudomonas sp. CGJS7]|uniref:VpsF family polysaccharide biosynthesis protein n=1 Tax=Pseudomonas sp. CGJS7 TaxID=3109348 RepID=UPI00300BEE23